MEWKNGGAYPDMKCSTKLRAKEDGTERKFISLSEANRYLGRDKSFLSSAIKKNKLILPDGRRIKLL